MKAEQINNQMYSIKDLENISGIKAHTIRIWEQRYNIFNPVRTKTNIRFYKDQDLKKLLNISVLINNGSKISKLKDLSYKEINDRVIATTDKDASDTVKSLLVSMINFDNTSFNKIIEDCIVDIGFEDCLELHIYPMFIKIGLLWQTNSINPAHEHFVSNILRQKLFNSIDNLEEPKKNAKKFLLFLPEFEQHEISLLYSYYLIKKNGHNVIYLGQNTPDIDVVKAAEIIKHDFLLTFFISEIQDANAIKILQNISSKTKYLKILISGLRASIVSNCKNANIITIKNPKELKEIL
ncbi:MAG: helix-turn-helix-type transcriptional regulator [Marinilabiliales bacterium]|nr:MAG: helix-turn-helix-type transcriptional regulator [Marinilabiliales bacterium]